MLAIRLMRMGAKKSPFYRVVVKEKRSKRDGKYLEKLGTYNPMTEPAEINLDHDRIDYWISVGAQPSETVASLIKHNPKMTEEEKAEAVKTRAEAKEAKRAAEMQAKADKLAAEKAEAEAAAAEKAAAEKAEADAAAAEKAEAEAAAAAEAAETESVQALDGEDPPEPPTEDDGKSDADKSGEGEEDGKSDADDLGEGTEDDGKSDADKTP